MNRSIWLIPFLFGATSVGAADKVTICHYTSSAKNPVVMINVSVNALDTHMDNHGYELPETWYEDADGDGYGDSESGTEMCIVPSGYVDNGDDPDDNDDTNPGDGGGDGDDCVPGLEC